ncbi:MAG: alpha/beta fold hydrolase [Nitrospina sp.]|jgi:uncharacterized protein|nr:alpha/beta fold hydrolase [Nitrospina sp.]MBT6600189.1 alpha/beta fold hydrolase [Nitrospina sp.]
MTEFVYLHGFASGPSSQKASAFKKKFKEIGISIYIPDLEGGNFENMTLSSQLNIIFNLLNQLNSKEVCLIGSSMGGYLASLVAELRDEVKAAYLIAPGFNFLDRWMNNVKLDFNDETSWKSKIPVFHYRYFETKYICSDIFKDAKNWGSTSFNREIPSRIIHGIYDEVVPIDVSKKFIASRPWCSLKELDSDHGLLSHLEWMPNDCMEFFKKLDLLSMKKKLKAD